MHRGYSCIDPAVISMNFLTISNSVLLFALSLVGSFFFIWLLLRTPLIFFFKDKPGVRKIHQQTVPRAGGICIAVCFFCMLFVWQYLLPDGFPRLSFRFREACMFITFCIVAIGFFDDAVSFDIKNKAKFFLEVLIAIEIIYFFGIQFSEIRIADFTISNKWVLAGISVFWMVGLSNAFNIIDGIDGLAGAIALISFATIGLLFWHAQAFPMVVLCVVFMGAIVGFLLHNISPASVFLGDTGSLFFGMMLSMLLMYLVSAPNMGFSIMTVFLVAGFPILDVSIAMGRRFVKAFFSGKGLYHSLRSMTVADSEHTHHRLVFFGLNHTQAALVLSMFSATLCIAAILIHFFSGFKYVVLGYVGLIVVWFLYWLSFFDRFVMFLKKMIFRRRPELMYRIGIVDADSILHHALINFQQQEFVFEFVSGKEIENTAAGQPIQLHPELHPDENFRTSPTWLDDTRQYSPSMIASMRTDNSASNPALSAQEGEGKGEPETTRNAGEYKAVLINCREPAEFEQKVELVRRLLNVLSCMIIMVVDQMPESFSSQSRSVLMQIVFIKKPFYVPILIKELYHLIKNGGNVRSSESFLKDTTILRITSGQ
jgi:UDP-GlcNAc:undecaprenyl-phosphate/decaprenyl-phosphate GlcNAc-1-phosphate transferase